ncbi:helix-turn-helix domain-containing protein [Acetobacter sp. AAB5]|uniref:helix-turn-helix domain-containing protein n=1 Tax=Acetobacter sp. AAB5 TaxID=3418370 RepID=UPI003CF2479F
MAQIVRLTTKQQRSGQEEAAQVAEQLSLLSDELLKHLPGEARIAISRATHALQKAARPDTTEGLWPGGFTMLSRMQTAAIWDAIRALPSDDRPNQVRHAFDLVLLNLRQDTGEVLLTRDQLAEEIDCAPRSVSTIMGTLEKMGVIRRERRKIEGVRGPGMAVYFINPHVAWNGSLDVRKAQAAETRPPMQLELLQGGAS